MALTIYIKDNNPQINKKNDLKREEVNIYLKKSFENILNLEYLDDKASSLHRLLDYLDTAIDILEPVYLLDISITHNMSEMAKAVSDEFYQSLWNPNKLLEKEIITCKDIYPYIMKGYKELSNNEDKYLKYNPSNGWGSHETFCNFLRSYLAALETYKDNPNIIIIAES
jgi:hypothetical protein